MTTRTFVKINDIFQCELLLENGSNFTIPLREDGYIFATGLCKAVGKQVNGWLRLKETKEMIKELEKSGAENTASQINNAETRIHASALIKKSGTENTASQIKNPDIHIRVSELIEVYKGGNNKYNQGTWVHPDLGLQLAQWCSPNFSLQVNKVYWNDKIYKAVKPSKGVEPLKVVSTIWEVSTV